MIGFAPYQDTTNDGQTGGGLFAGLDPDYALKQQQLSAARAFSNGLPKDANGNVDYAAAGNIALQKGAPQEALGLFGIGLQQRQMQMGFDALKDLDGGGSAPTNATPTASSGANPNVVNYIKTQAPTYGINPNVALAVASSEGLRGFDPNSNANLGDGGSSAGPFQLHYGGVAGGGNSSPGLGDDFTAATGLDARDPATWKAQVDFALAHAAKNGWGAWHGAAKAGIGEFAGIGQPTSRSTASVPLTQVAQNGANDATDASSVHPYAAAVQAPQPPSADPGQPAPTSIQVAGNSGTPMPAVSSSPSTTGSNQQSAIDPTLGGLLRGKYVGDPGGYINDLTKRAAYFGLIGNQAAATIIGQQATRVENALTRSETPEIKNYATALRQGYSGTMMQFAADQAAQTAAAAAKGKAPYEIHEVQASPGGPTTYQSTADIAASPTPVVAKQPAVFAQDQDALGKTLSAIPEQMQQRQIAQERIDAMSKLLETFQTGAGADQKAAAVAGARALGFDIPDSATANPAAVEQFAKNATANIFAQAKSLGGKILVSELAGLQKSNANANMQPGSNAAILAQQKGLLDWQEAHDQALLNWSQQPQNQNAYTAAPFEAQWMKANPPSAYVAKAKLDIAPLGVSIPAPAQRTVGQRYNIPGKGIFRWMGGGWSAS